MMSNYKAELERRGLSHQLDALLDEIALIRRELGYPIMVTPISQYIGAQAVLNHTAGERYRIITDEVIKYILGHYGDLAAPVDPDVKARVMAMPRTKELLDWEPSQRSIEDLRKEYDPDLSDEEFPAPRPQLQPAGGRRGAGRRPQVLLLPVKGQAGPGLGAGAYQQEGHSLHKHPEGRLFADAAVIPAPSLTLPGPPSRLLSRRSLWRWRWCWPW